MQKTLEYHKSWILLLSSMLIIVILTPYISSSIENSFAEKRTVLTQKRNRLEHQLQQWEKDNKTALDISKTVSKGEIKNLLAASNREAFIAQIDTFGAKSRLGHLRYILSPAKPWNGGAHFPGIQKISTSTLLIEADAPHDKDIYHFINSLNKLDGKIILNELSITPIHKVMPKTLPAYNLHIIAKYQWLSNEVIQ